MTGQSYQTGTIASNPDWTSRLIPPPQTPDSQEWEVEPGIRLHHFSAGQGRSVLFIHGGPGYPYQSPLAVFKPLEKRYCFHYYDQRGCGRSTRPVDVFNSRNYFSNFQKLNRALGLEAQIGDIERIRRIL
jgi:proline iminopeptidase